MVIRAGETPIIGVRKGETAIRRVYQGSQIIYDEPAVYEYPVVLQSTGRVSSQSDTEAYVPLLTYAFNEPITVGNWLVAFLSTQDDTSWTGAPGWTSHAVGIEGGMWPRALSKKITADTPQEDTTGWPNWRRAAWIICEVAGVDPAATSLPVSSAAAQGWGFEGRTSHTQARTILKDKTLFFGFQVAQGATAGQAPDPSYAVRGVQASAGAARTVGLFSQENQPAGKQMPMMRTTGSDYASSFVVAKITRS